MNEETIKAEWGFRGKLLNVEVLEVALSSGGQGRREIVRHPGAAVVLARGADGRFIFVRQFRKALDRVMLEVIAGTREEGEDPEQCADREIREESGCRATSLTKLGTSHPAPGYTDECLHMFAAEVIPDPDPLSPDDDEMLDVVTLSEAEVEAAIRCGDITDAKTVAIWALYRMNNGAAHTSA